MQQLEHHIQSDILVRLCFAQEVRFTDLKPKYLENNIFMYHLKQLIKLGFVVKNQKNHYELTPKGMAYADKLNYATKHQSIQPKVVAYLQINDCKGTQLYWRRKVQPSLGWVGVPVGKIEFGENCSKAAERVLKEKTGLTNIKLVYRGTANMKFMVQDTLVSHILCMVYTGKTKNAKPKLANGELGEAFWADDKKIDNLIPSVDFIIDQLKAHPHGYFFAEQDFNL